MWETNTPLSWRPRYHGKASRNTPGQWLDILPGRRYQVDEHGDVNLLVPVADGFHLKEVAMGKGMQPITIPCLS